MACCSSPPADASSFMAAMDQLNRQHPPDRIARPSYSALEPVSSLRVPQASPSGPRTSISSDGVSPPSASTRPDPFLDNLQAQIDALIALPEPERREKARVQAASRANDVCHLLDRKFTLFKLKPHMRSEAYAKQIAELQMATRASYSDYLAHLCVTFRFNELPLELLMEIFRLVVWPFLPDLSAAIRLTHVCRLWRSVVIADKHIWNPVCFGNPEHFDITFALMERAGPTDIDIRICDNKHSPLSKHAMARLIDRLFLQLPSLRRLDIIIFSRESVIPILDGLRRIPSFGCPMILEHLGIHSFYAVGMHPESFPSLPIFGGAILPSLRHLCLNGVNIQWEVDILSRLTTLDLRRIAMDLLPSSADFRAVLNGASGLEKMILDGAGPKYEQGDTSVYSLPPVQIPSLRILVLGGLSDSYAEYVLSHFIAPNVLDLTIMFPIDNIYTKLITTLTTMTLLPKVKILILVKVPLDGLPIPTAEQALFVRWLDSMPDLTFIRLLQTSSDIFEILKSERTQTLPVNVDGGLQPVDQPSPKRLICPHVVYMDYQNNLGEFDILTTWIAHRRIMGYPLKKVWLPPSAVVDLSNEHKVKLRDALGELGTAHPARYRTMEEEAICKGV